MKKLGLIVICVFVMTALNAQENNDFYDDAPTHYLSGPASVMVDGEVEKPVTLDLGQFEKRSCIVKEAEFEGDGNSFIGAYRYDGYSLYDILNDVVVEKKNRDEFGPIIDQYVVVENDAGDKVVISWGEIYYPVNRHGIIIATEVARIVPSKTNELWPMPQNTKLICSNDLITERNIENPSKITILSADVHYEVEKGMSPMHSPAFTIKDGDKELREVNGLPADQLQLTYETIFYGRGKGIHSTTPFKGILLKELLAEYFPAGSEKIKNGYFVIAGLDGYRAVFTFSEVMNRNDQSEFMVVDEGEGQDGGRFRIFPAADFFSDRAIKSVKDIRLLQPDW